MHPQHWTRGLVVALVAVALIASAGCRRRKYENPIAKDTEQPDKVLFDKAIKDIEKGRYEVARLTLQTLINTYDTSEFLAKAKLAIADSWFREGGSHALGQAEAEYKDFILFYPTMEEAAESQQKICMIHYKQMEKPDRDPLHAMRAEDECRQLLVQFPNSKFAPQATQLLRNIQEAIAEGEFRVGNFYHNKGSHPAASNRLQNLVDTYPLYSGADTALWMLGDSYSAMGTRFRPKAGDAYTRLVKDYPLSPWVDEAKQKLGQLELPVPEADPVALARMKYEQENLTKAGKFDPVMGVLKKGPNTRLAAKSGQPRMEPMRPTIPANVPVPAGAAGTGTTDVTVQAVSGPSAIDTQPDARLNPPKPEGEAAPATTPPTGEAKPPAEGSQPAAAAPAAPAKEEAKPAQSGKKQPKPPKQPKPKKQK
jgi:outer membrane protein assembly factor BamD